VQVGLVSLARELKGDLDRIAARADTGSSKGLHQLLQGELVAAGMVCGIRQHNMQCMHVAGAV
jgi:uncharacterized membrane protein